MSAFFRAVSSYFSPTPDRGPPTRASRRQQALSSTKDAFSLPQHSPSLRNSSSARSSSDSPSAYAYPPRPPSYDPPSASLDLDKMIRSTSTYSDSILANDPPSPSSSGRRATHLLPLHHALGPPLPSYPPLRQTWSRLQAWLSNEYTELGDTLNYGCQLETLADIERQLGYLMPPAVRDSYLVVDGQEPESSSGCAEGLFFGLTLLPLEDVLAEWMFWREVDQDPETGSNERLRALMRSVPPNWVRSEYSCRGWLPLVSDRAGNYLGVDLDPGEGGTAGQVIIFGRDFDTKVVMYRGEGAAGWANWLASFVEDLENGEGFELSGQGEGGSDGSEDDIGYESYFFNPNGGSRGYGGTNGGQGLRLAGEYKGWNVLEAWADRSIRSWADSGLGLDTSDEHLLSRQAATGLGLAVFSQDGGGVEIPIPVLAAEEGVPTSPVELPLTTTPLPQAHPRYGTSRAGQSETPTISITVPPPQPLELPTRSDLNPSLYRPLLDESSDSNRITDNVASGSYRSNPVLSSPDDDDEVSKAAHLPLPISSTPSPVNPILISELPSVTRRESSDAGSSSKR